VGFLDRATQRPCLPRAWTPPQARAGVPGLRQTLLGAPIGRPDGRRRVPPGAASSASAKVEHVLIVAVAREQGGSDDEAMQRLPTALTSNSMKRRFGKATETCLILHADSGTRGLLGSLLDLQFTGGSRAFTASDSACSRIHTSSRPGALVGSALIVAGTSARGQILHRCSRRRSSRGPP
jgi:hypothetical protein